jgi:hypothetical protein
MSKRLAPVHLVEILGEVFRSFDEKCEQYEVTKIKTIGDAYMAGTGTPQSTSRSGIAALDPALFSRCISTPPSVSGNWLVVALCVLVERFVPKIDAIPSGIGDTRADKSDALSPFYSPTKLGPRFDSRGQKRTNETHQCKRSNPLRFFAIYSPILAKEGLCPTGHPFRPRSRDNCVSNHTSAAVVVVCPYSSIITLSIIRLILTSGLMT